MASDAATIIVGLFSFLAVLISVLSGWRLHALQNQENKDLEAMRTAQVQSLADSKSAQEEHLELLRSQLEAKLDNLRDQQSRQREKENQAKEVASLVARYRDPLVRSAYDLQSRIYSIYTHGYGADSDIQYVRRNTLFVLAEFLGWLEIIRREMQFLDLGRTQITTELMAKLDRIQRVLAVDWQPPDNVYLWHGDQRAIGELMITQVPKETPGHRRQECIGYATFLETLETPEMGKWLTRLGDAIGPLPGQEEKPQRLAQLQVELVELIGFLDEGLIHFPNSKRRRKLEPTGIIPEACSDVPGRANNSQDTCEINSPTIKISALAGSHSLSIPSDENRSQ